MADALLRRRLLLLAFFEPALRTAAIERAMVRRKRARLEEEEARGKIERRCSNTLSSKVGFQSRKKRKASESEIKSKEFFFFFFSLLDPPFTSIAFLLSSKRKRERFLLSLAFLALERAFFGFNSDSMTSMLRLTAIRPSAVARAALLAASARGPTTAPVARSPLLHRRPFPSSSSSSSSRSLSLQPCFAEPKKKNKQTKEQKDKEMEQKEKLVKC